MRFFAIASVFFTAVVVVFASPIVECGNLSSIHTILTDFETTTGPIISQFSNYAKAAKAASATTTILNPLIDDYSMAMSSAQSSLNLLCGQPMNVIMASANGITILTASDIKNTLENITKGISTAVKAVVKTIGVSGLSTTLAFAQKLTEFSSSLSSIVNGLINGHK